MLNLTLVHTNDTHSHIEPNRVVLDVPTVSGPIQISALAGGFSMLDSFVHQSRLEAQSVNNAFLYVDAGDTFEGSLYFNCFKGQANVTLYNEIGLDYMAVGNHEFDSGDDLIAGFIQSANFPVIASNMQLDAELETPLKKQLTNLYCQNNPHQPRNYHIHYFGDVAVGIVGLSLETMHSIASPSQALLFNEVISTARQLVDELKGQGVGPIILLSHLGIEIDRMVAQQVDHITIIVGGHSHLLQGDFSNLGWGKGGEYGDSNHKTPIVHAGFNAMAVGKIVLRLDDDGDLIDYSGQNSLLLDGLSINRVGTGDITDSDRECALAYLQRQTNVNFSPNSSRVEDLLNRCYRPSLSLYFEKDICYVDQALRHVRLPDDLGGSMVAPLVAKSFVDYIVSQGGRADIGLVNAGAIRASLTPGPLTYGDILGKILPFPIYLQAFTISGEELASALYQTTMISVNQLGSTGSYPYFFGLRYRKPLEHPIAPDSAVLEVLNESEQWELLSPHRLYRVATTSYVAQGKEGFVGFTTGIQDLVDFEIRSSEVFSWFMQQPHRKALTPLEIN